MFIKRLLSSTNFKFKKFSSLTLKNQPVLSSNRNVQLIQSVVPLSSTLNEVPFYHKENKYAFNVINKNNINGKGNKLYNHHNITDESSFNELLNRNWRSCNAYQILDAFKSAKQYCIDNIINVSDHRFDNLVDGLMDHCEKLTYDELLDLLICLSEYPPCDSYASHNFHDIWSCLDDICCWKVHQWNLDQVLTIADAWFMLNLSRYSDFIFDMLDKFTRKADSMSKDQLVHIFFLFNVCRNRPVDFAYEAALQNKIYEISIDEMAVIALGYFKTKSKIKVSSISEAMIKEVTKCSKSIHEISLTAIMKVLCYTKTPKLLDDLNKMLDSLYPEMDRFSDMCCMHIALVSTGVQTPHVDTIRKSSQKIVKNIHNIRLKDVERILNVLTMFDLDPKTEPDLYQACFEELHKDSRLAEMIKYPRCFTCALHFLSLRGLYSYKLMDRILEFEFIETTFGKHPRLLPREIFSLDTCIDIECPDYTGNRLPSDLKYKAAKWLTSFTPSRDQFKKLTFADNLMLDTMDSVERIVGNKDMMYVDHVLPHFPRAVIIVCKDQSTGQFVKPEGFERYVLGDVMFPLSFSSYKWYALVVLGWNNTIRNSSLPLGHSLMKVRQLRKIGYNPVLVILKQLEQLNEKERDNYILECLGS